jgi:NADH-quinone oxidoreductase subunit G
MSGIEIEIDGKKLSAQPNQMVIQVADAAGIYIPRFCYHKHLSIAANCRMCLVEVEKAPKPAPACATPVMPGMKIFTRSPKAIAAQRAVMEFLLINHPLDCPICDQGGECELQDLSMGYGKADSNYIEGKRSVKDENLGPLIATEMTRCIQCTRCVRFGDEIAGVRELGLINRGEDVEIRTYLKEAVVSEVSGNVIDLCPVGALTSKPFRFTARAWELQQCASIAPHDCVGSHINIHTRYGKVMRVVPRENQALNQTWISDRDRFSYESVNHPDRLTRPLLRNNGKLEETDWPTALEFTATQLQAILKQYGADQLGALATPNATLEEFYLLQKLLRSLGSSHVDHRLRQVDFSGQESMSLFPGFNRPMADIEHDDVIVLIGSNIQKEQPMLATRIRKAVARGAQVISINMLDYKFNFKVATKHIIPPQQFAHALTNLPLAITQLLSQGKKVSVLIGALALNHPKAAIISELARRMAEQYRGVLSVLTEGANTAGAWLSGMIPHRGAANEAVLPGLNAEAMLKQPRKSYILFNVEFDFDCADPVAAVQALEEAEFVIALSSFKNNTLFEHADVILPIAPFTETSGTFVNAAGDWQSFKGVAKNIGESRPAWKVLRVLGNLLNCEGFNYITSEEARDELKQKINVMQPLKPAPYDFSPEKLSASSQAGLVRIGEIPIYSGDGLTRRATSLQEMQPLLEGPLFALRLSQATALKFSLKEGEWVTALQGAGRVQLPVVFDSRVPADAVLIAGGIPGVQELPELFGEIEIKKKNLF